jgi:hypothetical protein
MSRLLNYISRVRDNDPVFAFGVCLMTIAWHEAQPIIAKELAFWLGDLLPAHGGKDYWTTYVINFLSIPQKREYAYVSPGDLLSLDAAALIRVALANCDELSANRLISEDVKPNLRLLQNARNGLSHLPARGISAREELKLLEPGLRLLQAMERGDEAIENFEDLLDRVRRVAREERSKATTEVENTSNEKPSPDHGECQKLYWFRFWNIHKRGQPYSDRQ